MLGGDAADVMLELEGRFDRLDVAKDMISVN